MREPFEINVPDMSHMIPIRISVAKVKSMSDADLLAALNGEDGRKGMMTMQLLQLLTAELQARSIARATKPHWSTVPSFWLLVTSVVLALIAAVAGVLALPQVQQHVSATQSPPPAPAAGQSTSASSQSPLPPSPRAPAEPPRKSPSTSSAPKP